MHDWIYDCEKDFIRGTERENEKMLRFAAILVFFARR